MFIVGTLIGNNVNCGVIINNKLVIWYLVLFLIMVLSNHFVQKLIRKVGN